MRRIWAWLKALDTSFTEPQDNHTITTKDFRRDQEEYIAKLAKQIGDSAESLRLFPYGEDTNVYNEMIIPLSEIRNAHNRIIKAMMQAQRDKDCLEECNKDVL